MDKLAECIQTTLRRGDVVSKYSVSQYVLLLPAPTHLDPGFLEDVLFNNFAKFYHYRAL